MAAVVGVSGSGVNVEGGLVFAEGAVRVPLAAKSQAQADVGRGVSGIDPEGSLIAANGLLPVTRGLQNVTQLTMRVGIVTPQGQRRPQVGHRLLWPLLLRQHHPQV